MITALLLTLAQLASAEPLPVVVAVDGALGMRGGITGQVTVEPWRNTSVGVLLTSFTDLYSFAPQTITWNLETPVNLHLGSKLAIGWMADLGKVELGGHLLIGAELLWVRETKTIPALDAPVTYRILDLHSDVGLAPELRFMAWEHWGLDVVVQLPLGRMATGRPDVERIYIGAGVVWRR